MAKVQNYIETDQEKEEGHADTRHNNFECETPDSPPYRAESVAMFDTLPVSTTGAPLLEASSVPPYLPRLTR